MNFPVCDKLKTCILKGFGYSEQQKKKRWSKRTVFQLVGIIFLSIISLLSVACLNIGSASDGASAGAKTEADAQAKKTINSELYDPVYTYEAIVNAPPGIVHEPNPSWSKTGYYTEKSGPADIDLWRQHIIKAFEGVEPLPENATDQQINRLYNQILFVDTHDYEPIDTIDRFPYYGV